VDRTTDCGTTPEFLKTIAQKIVQSGEAWLSTTVVNDETVLRACITNYMTQTTDVQALVQLLGAARESVRHRNSHCLPGNY
ncbi:hypothetical protein, partial [Polaromonas sp.]|uniref:hypothetical protein n=1 Tax=Polaromonas sp. TaxID=1869339 RepID=UPI003753D420